MNSRDHQPSVLLGVRSEARGRVLERALAADGRLALLGVHTRREPLLNAVAASEHALLILDAQLADATALDVLYRAQLQRPCLCVTLAATQSGEFVVESLRAGALDCVVWDGNEGTLRGMVDTLVAAADHPPDIVQIGAWRARPRRRRLPPSRASQCRILALVGARRAGLLCDAIDHLPTTFPAVVVCQEPVDDSVRRAFAAQLALQASLAVQLASRTVVADGSVIIVDRRTRLQLDNSSSGLRPRVEPQTREGAGSTLDWLRTMLEASREGKLGIVVVAAGHVDAPTLELVTRVPECQGALARLTSDGYQLRWPLSDKPLRFGATAFWEHVSQHIVSMGQSVAEEGA